MAVMPLGSVFDGPPISYVDPAMESHGISRRERRQLGGKRPDIQGLRALAVIAVVINHLTGHPQGGFVGVDVFFVISGFLITSLLLREGERSGTISFLGFYKRRIRRLLPAALTVIVGTLVAAHFVFTAERFHTTAVDALWATLFSANWRSVNIGTDYFQAQGPVSPLQHYWSLAVEEQFYVVWPLVLLVVLLVCKRLFAGRKHATAAAGTTVALALTLSSLVLAWRQSSDNPIVAYFSTFTRGWELGLGAILAICVPYMRGSRLTISALSWLGMIVIGLSLFFVNSSHFPFPGALLPCIGSAMVIAAHTTQVSAANPLLTNRVANYVGDISYSVYLVHFPIIIFTGVLITDSQTQQYLVAALLTIGVSVLLFELIEDPIRSSNWLKARAATSKDQEPDSRSRSPYAVVGAALVVAALGVGVLAAPAGGAKYEQVLGQIDSNSSDSGTTTKVGTTPAGPQQRALTAKLRSALTAKTWPSFSVPMGVHVAAPGPSTGFCAQHESDLSRCTFGNPKAKHVMYLLGDSTSVAYEDAFITMVKNYPDWRVRATGGSACAFADKVLIGDAGNVSAGDCTGRNASIVKEINRVHPDVAVVTSVRGDTDYQTHVGNQLAKIKDAVGKIVIMPAPPQGLDPNVCFTKVSTPIDCVSKPTSDYESWLVGEQKEAKAVNGVLINPTPWFTVNGFCPIFIDRIPVRHDKAHMTPQYAVAISPVIQEALVATKVLPSSS